MAKRHSQRQESESAARRIEWILGGCSAAVLMAMISYLFVLGLSADGKAPELVIIPGAIEQRAGAFHLSLEVANHGGKTAADVRVQGKIEGDAATSSEIVFDYVPAGSQQRGTLVFGRDPRGTRTEIGVVGYRDP